MKRTNYSILSILSSDVGISSRAFAMISACATMTDYGVAIKSCSLSIDNYIVANTNDDVAIKHLSATMSGCVVSITSFIITIASYM